MKLYLLVPLLLLFASAACERADQAVDAYNRAKELKSEFQKKSEEIQKDLAEKTEGYKDRIRKKTGLTTRDEPKEEGDTENGRENGGSSRSGGEEKD